MILKESELRQVIENSVINKVCENVIYEEDGKWKIKNKGDKKYDSIDEAKNAVKEILNK